MTNRLIALLCAAALSCGGGGSAIKDGEADSDSAADGVARSGTGDSDGGGVPGKRGGELDAGGDRAADATVDAAEPSGAGGTGGAGGAGGDSGGAGGIGDVGGGAAADNGLDTRPQNPTCIAPERSMLPATLKASGCVDPNDATTPAAGLIPYAVNSPLWSDGAAKERFLALPDNTKIHVDADDDWDLPAGTVLMKTFLIGGKRIETRLFVRHSDGWAGYSYEWDDAQTDATLLPDATTTKAVGSQTWMFPSRKQCMDCHTPEAGFSLGLETGQLNGDYTYPNGRRANQVATFDHIGLFDAPLTASTDALVRFPQPSSAEGTIENRAKSYLHANCSGCHRPGGVGMTSIDLRYRTAFGAMMVCNVAPKKSGFGTVYISPGDPTDSAIVAHMRSTMQGRMPPIASSLVDSVGVQVIDDWISSLIACP